VLRALGGSGETPLRPWLDPYGQHRDCWVRLEAQAALARLGDDAALRELVRELRLAADGRRDRLARLLGRLPRHRLAPALADLLTHADPHVRLAAGAALHYAGHPRSPALLDALASPRPALRARARAYLSQDLDRNARKHLRDLREVTRHRLASAALDRVLREHPPRSAAFGQFQPTDVVLF